MLNIEGKLLQAFIDTGSQVTLIKKEAVAHLSPRKSFIAHRGLRGVAGKELPVIEELDVEVRLISGKRLIHRVIVVDAVSFPGDLLVGVDLLRRVHYKIIHDADTQDAYLHLDNEVYPLQYEKGESLGLVSFLQPTVKPPVVRLAPCCKTVCPAHTGMYVTCSISPCFSGKSVLISSCTTALDIPRTLVIPQRDRCSVFVVNLTAKPVTLRNGSHFCVAEEVDVFNAVETKDDLFSERAAAVDLDSHKEVPDFDWEEDEFDKEHGLQLADDSQVDDLFCVLPGSDTVGRIDAALEASAIAESALIEADSEEIVAGPSLGHLNSKKREQLKEVFAKFPSLFSGDKTQVGLVPGVTHKIVTGDASPLCTRQWRMPESAKEKIRKECDDMLKAGIIEPSTSPWLSPVVLVKKKDGSLRFCVDYRNLNSVTVADTYPLPRIDELVDELRDTQVFSLLDSRSAYWSVAVEPSDKPKTAFSDGYRLFQFRRMPFGLSTAPTTFQRTMNVVLSPVLGRHTLAYLDDVVVYSPDFNSHLIQLEETLKILNDAGFKLNLAKCEFAVQEFRFLGFKVTPEGILPDPEKVRSIVDMTPPRNAKGVRRFLGATGFFRKHIPKYAAIAAPLTQLTRKDQSFRWGTLEQEAFQSLKDKLASAPILQKPRFNDPFEVHTDASQLAIGACLMQRDAHGNPSAVAYFSRKLRGAETRYSATDAEALAVVEGVRAFDPYIYGRQFTVYTDHRPLVYVFTRKTKSARMSRWAYELSHYQFQITYKQGVQHKVPDMLSRSVGQIDLADVDPTAMREEQLKDSLLLEIIEYLEERSLPKRKLPLALDEFSLQNGVLYHIRELPGHVVHQLVVPRSLRAAALKLAHDSAFASHPGVFRTYQKLRDLFYFPNMLRDVKSYVASCATCQRRKGTPHRAPLAAAPEVSAPFEKVSADLVDCGLSTAGYRYILVLIDHLTRFLQLIPVPSKEAEVVAEAYINDFLTIFGPPRLLQTDGGCEFTNRLFTQVCSIVKTKTHLTIACHPQANGMVERSNKVVKEALATLTERHPLEWHQYVPQVRLALNSAFHRSVGDQPLYLLMGHHGHFPVGLSNDVTFATDAAKEFHDSLQEARYIAIETSRRARETWARNYNKRGRKAPEMVVGSLILFRNFRRLTGPRRTLGSRWDGPARIMKRVGPVTYITQDVEPPYKERRLHVNQIKPFRTLDELAFVSPPDPQSDPSVDCQQLNHEEDADIDPREVLLLSSVRPC